MTRHLVAPILVVDTVWVIKCTVAILFFYRKSPKLIHELILCACLCEFVCQSDLPDPCYAPKSHRGKIRKNGTGGKIGGGTVHGGLEQKNGTGVNNSRFWYMGKNLHFDTGGKKNHDLGTKGEGGTEMSSPILFNGKSLNP